MADQDSPPELRLDPVSREWVIVAPQRSIRPHAAKARATPNASQSSEDCPFCPGNESMTPPPVLELPGDGVPGQWQVRAFANKFPALTPDAPALETPLGLFQRSAGRGRHEVIVETPAHDRVAADFTHAEMELVVRAYRQRFEALMGEEHTKYVVVFKNQGGRAGASLAHSHSQILGASVVPEAERRRERTAAAHFEKTRRCLLCDVIDAELRDASRVVSTDESFVVFEPFSAARPGETWIAPIRHALSFGQVKSDELREFASALRGTLQRLRFAFEDPDFVYAIHSASRLVKSGQSYHWYLQLIPQITTLAGLELASGMYVNTVAPEAAAAAMRTVDVTG